jgi:hypothetical protein
MKHSAEDSYLDDLRKGLELAVKSYNEKDDLGREAAIISVHLINDYLRLCGIEPELLRPLSNLELALQDVDLGLTNPMFIVRRRHGKPPDQAHKLIDKVKAAVAMSLYMQDGMSKPDAAKHVEAKIKYWDICKRINPGRDLFSHNTVDNWRDTFSEGRNTDPLGRAMYFHSLKRAETDPRGPKAVADLILGNGPSYRVTKKSD